MEPYKSSFNKQANLALLVVIALLAAIKIADANPSGLPPISRQQWASLNPYGSDVSAYPKEEQAKIAELQRQWDKFLPYLVS